MQIPEEIFRAYDVRGLLDQVTPEIAKAIGRALVKKTGAKTVVVGRDMRSTSPQLATAAIEGITMAGADVIDIGLCTTSMYNYAVAGEVGVDAGLMVTASHNPPEYNGIKMALANGIPVSGTEILAVMKEGSGSAESQGTVSHQDILQRYLDFCLQAVDVPLVAGTKVVVDYGNGMGALSIRPLADRLGLQLIELYAEPDARFPNHEANPAKEETLHDVCEAVRREGADFGLALDGDADRIAFIDEKGIPLRGDLTLALLARDLLKRKPGSIVVTSPNQSWSTTEMIEKYGGVNKECRIGRTFVIQAMHEHTAQLSGEVSSHFFFEESANLEAVDLAFAKVLSIWKQSGQRFSELVSDLRRYHNSGEVNVHVADKSTVLECLRQTYVPEATVVNMLDGIRCEFGREWWFIVRPSNTEPLLRLIVEATSQELMQQKRDELAVFIQQT